MLATHVLRSALVLLNTLLVQKVLAEPEWAGRLTDVDLRGSRRCSGRTSTRTALSVSTWRTDLASGFRSHHTSRQSSRGQLLCGWGQLPTKRASFVCNGCAAPTVWRL